MRKACGIQHRGRYWALRRQRGVRRVCRGGMSLTQSTKQVASSISETQAYSWKWLNCMGLLSSIHVSVTMFMSYRKDCLHLLGPVPPALLSHLTHHRPMPPRKGACQKVSCVFNIKIEPKYKTIVSQFKGAFFSSLMLH